MRANLNGPALAGVNVVGQAALLVLLLMLVLILEIVACGRLSEVMRHLLDSFSRLPRVIMHT